ncbi:S8 family peptidase [Brevibacillus ginsengisoli]|uniref:S8 family peptidase n=1 Tax=Brevibacillus ginsengisoli TaxID=363854 RepID=UPI003CF68A46
MHKILTFQQSKGFHQCVECLQKEEKLKSIVKNLSHIRSVVVAESDLETLSKLLGKSKYQVSNEVKVRLHFTDEIPWGVAEVGAEKFWTKTRGHGVKVAVLDTGILSTHPDLRGRVKQRVNFVSGSGSAMDGHGTHIAGTIAAIVNNRGIVGIAPEVDLYDVRAFGPDGTANISDIIQGINWAIENKMDVINMSFGSEVDNFALRNAIRQAQKAGITMVASAGNNGKALEYPAAYKGVVSVGAIDQSGKLADFSSRGKGLSTVAPGVKIKSTWLNNGYLELDGTSMAAAHISGVHALRLAEKRAAMQAKKSAKTKNSSEANKSSETTKPAKATKSAKTNKSTKAN